LNGSFYKNPKVVLLPSGNQMERDIKYLCVITHTTQYFRRLK